MRTGVLVLAFLIGAALSPGWADSVPSPESSQLIQQDRMERALLAALASDLETQTDNDRLTTALENALSQISEEHRVLIMLYEVEGYSLGEIQSMLDLPQGTLKSRLHRARARLREILEQDGTFFESHSCDQQRFVK